MFLAVETSSAVGGLAVADHQRIIALTSWNRAPGKKRHSHSEIITAELQTLLDRAEIHLTDLRGLIVTVGPGSFTGIRVGLNHVKTLSYALHLPIYAFNSLETLAYSYSGRGRVLCMINAFRNMVYLAEFDRSEKSVTPVSSPAAVAIDKLDSWVKQPMPVLGDGYAVYEAMISAEIKNRLEWRPNQRQAPTAEDLVGLFFSRQKENPTFDWKDLQPLYIRPSSAEENREKGLLKPLNKLG